MTDLSWFVLHVNPEPWAIGPLGVGKKGGKFYPYVGRNNQLYTYKEAVREAIGEVEQFSGKLSLQFFFWRRLDSHESGRAHIADVTNLQKATEDALQGVLFANDRDVAYVRSILVEQTADTKPCVVVSIMPWDGFDKYTLPRDVYKRIDAIEVQMKLDNTWRGPA